MGGGAGFGAAFYSARPPTPTLPQGGGFARAAVLLERRARTRVPQNMTYRIEYVRATSDAESVCQALMAQSDDLDDAEEEAFARSEVPRVLMGATGFLIRDGDEVVTVTKFDA